MDIKVNKNFLLNTAKEILMCDSPSGFCYEVMEKVKNIAEGFGYKFEYTNKGCGVITIEGENDEKTIGLSAHVDTLGAMVRSVTSSGTLKFTIVGGPTVPTLDSEYCKIRTREGKIYTGTFLSTSPSTHVYKDASSKSRDAENMEIRIDEVVKSKEDVNALGIFPGDFLSTSPSTHVYKDASSKSRDAENMEIRIDEVVKSKEDVNALGIFPGDYIFIDPKTTVTESGFLKSRFIDDKGSVAALLALLELLHREGKRPKYKTKIMITVYEEVGHGASYIPHDITEMLAVDMGCIGDDLSCTEYDVSICAKDSGGPYDYNMVTDLVNLAYWG